MTTRRTRVGAAALAVGLLTACGGGDRTDSGLDASADAADGSVRCDPGAAREVRPIAIAGCDGLGPGTEDCHARILWDASRCCPGSPCDRLVVFWAGGNQTCDDLTATGEGQFDAILGGFVERGFVAACAQPYTTDGEGGAYPYHLEWDRMNHALSRLRSEVAEVWDGTHLLISGSSHGGTAPLVMIASRRALRDHAETWTGTTHTAVVMFDGISNPRTLEEWAGSQPVASRCRPMHQRWVGRYGDGTPLLHSCGNGACYCSGPAHASDWAMDTVLLGAVDPTSPYACEDFAMPSGTVLYRLVTCSGTPRANACDALGGDIIPDEQQSLMYDALSTCPGIDASYASYACPHIRCGGFGASTNCGGAEAVDWLEANGW